MMFLFVLVQKVLEERTGRHQDQLVSFYLLAILTSQGHISEIFVLSKISKCGVDVFLEVVPFQTKLFRHYGTISTDTDQLNRSQPLKGFFIHPPKERVGSLKINCRLAAKQPSSHGQWQKL